MNHFSLEETFKIRNPQEHPLHLSLKSWMVLFIAIVVLFMQDCFHPGLILMANTTSAREDESALYLPKSVHQKAISYLTPEHCPSKQDSYFLPSKAFISLFWKQMVPALQQIGKCHIYSSALHTKICAARS